jgi:uncharacterized coiled-coil protein SlyX
MSNEEKIALQTAALSMLQNASSEMLGVMQTMTKEIDRLGKKVEELENKVHILDKEGRFDDE